jgi:hypothetical protein
VASCASAHFSYPDSIRTRARRFLRYIPSQACFEPLTRTTVLVVLVLLVYAIEARVRDGTCGNSQLGLLTDQRVMREPSTDLRQ